MYIHAIFTIQANLNYLCNFPLRSFHYAYFVCIISSNVCPTWFSYHVHTLNIHSRRRAGRGRRMVVKRGQSHLNKSSYKVGNTEGMNH